ncbi:Coiled-coil domain-containing protein 84 [Entomophthora muscae]|uniref:Coiled-coil domain-containing protein 84 n=1 Tax=Entomophthora muscae TaxID=34485 RepID=A0ACC2TA64_9FUNG|nr:Coiled-coil domain-containing protein 84 [Entomophthora muscae]
MAKRQKINNQHNLFACHQIFKHLASNSHRSNVESFWNLHRPFTIKSKVQNKKVGDPVKGCSFLKDQFILTKQALEEVLFFKEKINRSKFHSKCKTRILSMNSASAKTLENEVKSKEPIVSMPLSTLRIFKKQPHPLNSNLNKVMKTIMSVDLTLVFNIRITCYPGSTTKLDLQYQKMTKTNQVFLRNTKQKDRKL